MVILCYVLAACLMVLGVFNLLGLTPERITQDLMDIVRPASKLRTLSEDVNAKRRRGGIYGSLQRIRNTMESTGRGKLFPVALTSVFAFAALGVFVAILLDNIFLIPSLLVAFCSIPFLYMSSAVEYYEKTMRNEMETALGIITNAYIRTDDIVVAVEENLPFIKPPLKSVFERFVEDSVIMPSNKEIIIRLRDRLDDAVFFEWCTTLLQCQDDRTLKENLNPVVSKLTDIRLINTQMAATIASAKTEFMVMIGFVLASVPAIAIFYPAMITTILTNPIGKFLVGIVSGITIFAYYRMRKVTKVVDFNS